MNNNRNQRRRKREVRAPVRLEKSKSRLITLGIAVFSAALIAYGMLLWQFERGDQAITQRDRTPSLENSTHWPQRHRPSNRSNSERITLSKSSQSELRLPVVPGLRKTPLGDVASKVDPSQDAGWQSEVFGAAATAQLKALGNLIAQHADLTADQLTEIAHQDIECQAFRPDLDEFFRDGTIAVRRAVKSSRPSASRGRAELARCLSLLREPYGDDQQLRVNFKTVRVNVLSETATTVSYFESSGTRPQGTLQQNGIWTCRWTLGRPPQLIAIAIHGFEEIVTSLQDSRTFTDCTNLVFGNSPAFKEQLALGTTYWLNNLDIAFGFPFGNQGLAIADVNGDGLDDVYVNQPAGLPNRMFIRQSDGTLMEMSGPFGLDWLDNSAAALFVDLDNDGDQDAAIALRNVVLIHENNGQGKFARRQAFRTPSHIKSISSADFDGDGDLDLFACGYNLAAGETAEDVFTSPIPYHDANNGGPNLLVRNDGQFSFADATKQVGLDANNRRFSYAAAWEDYDNDGDMDLYVANDYGRNNLYRNQQGRFVDVAAVAGVEDIGAGMSVSWGDYNQDGLMDLYVGNMFSSAGNRITHQSQFQEEANATTKDEFRRHARGNSLFENSGGGRFHDVSVQAGVTMGLWAWGSLFVDINNDGRQDLCVANGFITTEDTGDL